MTDFLYYFIRYEQSHLSEIAPSSAQKNINIRILNNVKLPLPPLDEQHRIVAYVAHLRAPGGKREPPLDEQHRIVAYLDRLQAKVDDLRRMQAETQTELEALMPSALAKAFAGEL